MYGKNITLFKSRDNFKSVMKKLHPLKDAFGMLGKFKIKSTKSTDELLKEIDEEIDPTEIIIK